MIPHNRPTLGKEEEDAAIRVLREGWLAQGEEVKKFENEFCDYLGLPHGHAVALSNGTSSLFLALHVLNGENKIHRAKLARVSFQDEEHQYILNSIVHPHIFQIIDKSFDKVSVKNKHPVFIVDGALIFESGLNNHLDYTIVITANMKHRMARVLENSNLSREDVLRRIELQWSDEEKVNLADFTLRNYGTEKELKAQIQKVYAELA